MDGKNEFLKVPVNPRVRKDGYGEFITTQVVCDMDHRVYREVNADSNHYFWRENGVRIYFTDCKDIERIEKIEGVKTEPRLPKNKVLIIEGGGAFGIIPAFFASKLEEFDNDWLNKVDCLSGCSIGGILALAWSAGISAENVLHIFDNKMKDCFEKRFLSYLNPIACPEYTNDGIDTVLYDIFGDAELKDIRTIFPNLDVFIPALNLTKNSYKVFDNITGKDDDIKLRDLAGFTSCAPSYYFGRENKDGDCMIDGGMIEVAPLLTTVTGLAGKRGIKFSDMDVLMIGCGEKTDNPQLSADDYNDLSLVGIANNVMKPYVTLSNSLSTLYWGRNMGFNSFTYWNPVKIEGDLDDTEQAKKCLYQYAADEYDESKWKSVCDNWLK